MTTSATSSTSTAAAAAMSWRSPGLVGTRRTPARSVHGHDECRRQRRPATSAIRRIARGTVACSSAVDVLDLRSTARKPPVPPALPPLREVESASRSRELGAGASELHGGLCGWLAGGGSDGPDWLARVLADADIDAVAPGDAFDRLREASVAQLEDREFGFELLLPEADARLYERRGALFDWCRGFVGGFGLAAGPPPPPSAQGREPRGGCCRRPTPACTSAAVPCSSGGGPSSAAPASPPRRPRRWPPRARTRWPTSSACRPRRPRKAATRKTRTHWPRSRNTCASRCCCCTATARWGRATAGA